MAKYLIYIILALCLFIPPAAIFISLRKYKGQTLFKHYFPPIAAQIEKKKAPSFVITPLLRKIIFELRNRVEILEALAAGHYKKAIKNLQKASDKSLKSKLLTIFSPDSSKEGLLKAAPERYLNANKFFQNAADALQEGDLEQASWNVQQAICLFAKEKAFYEQGKSLLLAGHIFRISSLFDTAFFMYEGAKNIFLKLQADNALAETFGYLGILSNMQQQYGQAMEYFEQALKAHGLSKNHSGCAEIYNQMALSLLQKGDLKASCDLALKAQKLHQKNKSENGIAFSLEITGRIKQAQKKYTAAIRCFTEAEKLYLQSGNLAAGTEAAFYRSQALFSVKKYQDAENILRQILEKTKTAPCCFHQSEAYSLLGLIYMQQKDWKRAKGLFEQSLSFELREGRLKAIACDYANIALAEKRLGRLDNAQKNLALAKEYAQNCGDDDFYQEMRKIN